MKNLFSLLLLTSALQLALPIGAQAGNINVVAGPGGGLNSFPQAMSGNGAVLGLYSDNSYEQFAFIGPNGNYTRINSLPGAYELTNVYDLSFDGSVAVGQTQTPNSIGSQAFRWVNGMTTGLGYLPGGSMSTASGVSNDGRIVVGTSYTGMSNEAFRWENGVMTGLGFLPGTSESGATGISGNGLVIIGSSGNPGYDIEAFRWENGIMTGLGLLPGRSSSTATATNEDGSIVVGTAFSGGNTEAFRWENGIITGLGFLNGGAHSEANGITANGATIIGYSEDSNGNMNAVVWRQGQIETLGSVLSTAGINTSAWTFHNITKISDDGNIMVGYGGLNGIGESFIANLTSGGLTTPIALGKSLNTVARASQSATQQAMQYAPQGLFAAQNINDISAPVKTGFAFRSPAEIAPEAGGFETAFSAFALGSYGIGANQDFDNHQWNGTFGIRANISEGLDVGLGLITGQSHQKLDFEGESDLDALGGLALLSFEPEENGFRLYATAYAADLKLEIKRGYLNGSGLDSSFGKTDGISYGTAVKLGWEEELAYGLSAMPYVEGRYANTKLDAYEEQGGSFSASYSKQKNDYAASRLGVEFDYMASDQLELMLRPAWGHRLTGENESFRADIGGLSQSLTSEAGDRNWGELTLGATYQATDRVKFTSELTGRSGDTAEPAATIMLGSSIKF